MSDERKHYEAVINDIAILYGEDRIAIRDEIKEFMKKHDVIEFSTTELPEEDLKRYADRLTAFYNQEKTWFDSYGCKLELDLEKILFNTTKNE